MKSETTDLTDAELNRMVAECEGIEVLTSTAANGKMGRKKGWGDGDWKMLPNYCASHDAILPCVRALTEAQQFDFTSLLCGLVSKEGGLFQLITAPARTLVLAYLKAKGKL